MHFESKTLIASIHFDLLSDILRDLKQFQRHLIIWGDHSSLLSHGFLLYTVKCVYDSSIFFTDQEMLHRCKKVVDVQSLVERPEIYIPASCNDSIAEKLAYIEARREDLVELSIPLSVGEVKIFDTMRFFQGICVHVFWLLNFNLRND